jgi:hypothetical protein
MRVAFLYTRVRAGEDAQGKMRRRHPALCAAPALAHSRPRGARRIARRRRPDAATPKLTWPAPAVRPAPPTWQAC